jgi:hypothetical protein
LIAALNDDQLSFDQVAPLLRTASTKEGGIELTFVELFGEDAARATRSRLSIPT